MPMPKGGTKARKPTALKLLEGTVNATRANPNEPETAASKVDELKASAPVHFDEEERAAWDRYADILGPLRVCSKEDFAALESLVTCWVQAQRLRAQIRADAVAGDKKLTYETVTESGSVIQRPKAALTTLNEVDRRLKDWLARFGLTPADRARVNSDGDKGGTSADDEFA